LQTKEERSKKWLQLLAAAYPYQQQTIGMITFTGGDIARAQQLVLDFLG